MLLSHLRGAQERRLCCGMSLTLMRGHKTRPCSPKVALLRSLLDDRVSRDRALHELNDTHGRPTAQVTIEAILYCVRERGVSALQEPANRERLSRCDAAALAQIDDRIVRLRI